MLLLGLPEIGGWEDLNLPSGNNCKEDEQLAHDRPSTL